MRRFGVGHGVVLLLLGFSCRGALATTLSQSLAALEQQRRQAAETMTAAAKAKQAQWCAELVQRTLGGEAAQ